MKGVLVVGAGPAGTSLALRLARRGIPVQILDARSFPRSKPCGDCLSPGATPLLDELGVLEAIRRRRPARLRGWRIRTPGGRWFGGDFAPGRGHGPPCGLSLPRSELDSALLDAAVDAGATFLPRQRVFRLLRDGSRVSGVVARDSRGRERTYQARVVIGADGLRSTVARRIGTVERGPRRRLALVGRFSGVAAPSARGELRIIDDGVVGVAPTGEGDGPEYAGRVNVTVVVPATRARAVSRDREDVFEEALRRVDLSSRFVPSRRDGPLEITGPFEMAPDRVADPGVLLVGDAAGYFDPLTGQGIYRALATARAAARHVARLVEIPPDRARSSPDPVESAILDSYRRAIARIVNPGCRVQRMVDTVVHRPVTVEAAGAVLSRRPALAGLLLEVTGDRLPASALLHPGRILAAAVRFTSTQSNAPPGR